MESPHINTATTADSPEDPHIVFPEGDDDYEYVPELRSSANVSLGDIEDPPVSAKPPSERVASVPATTTTTTEPLPVIPMEDLSEKKKLAGYNTITYFDSRKQPTLRMTKEMQKQQPKKPVVAKDIPVPEEPTEEENAKKPGDFPAKKDAKLAEKEGSDQVGATNTNTILIGNNDQPSNVNPALAKGSYLSAMTPAEEHVQLEKQAAFRPTYLSALDSCSFKLDGQAQEPRPGAQAFGSANDLRGSIIIGDGPGPQDWNASMKDLIASGKDPVTEEMANKLAVALEVHEEDLEDALSVATPQNLRDSMHRKQETNTFVRILSGCSVAVLVAFFGGLGLGFLLKGDQPPSPTLPPTTDAPTQESISIPEELVLMERVVPDFSMAAIENDPESPQARAYDWLLEELSNPSNLVLPINRLRQRFALATFYYSTEGDEWFENAFWLNHTLHECLWFAKTWWTEVPYDGFDARFYFNENANPCEWPNLESGLNFDGHQYYRHFWLWENGLGGTLPPELGLLTDLKSMYLYKGSYSGQIPSQIGFLKNLRVLNMAVNDLSGTLPTQLGAMYSLRGITVFSTEVGGKIPSQLGQLTRMSTLNIDENRLTGTIPTVLGGPNKILEEVWLSRNMLSGTIPSELGALPLRDLRVFLNQLSGPIPSEFGEQPKLQFLQMYGNHLTGTLPLEFGQLDLPADLNFASNNLEGSIPSELGNISNVVRMRLDDNQLTGNIPSEFGQWTSLAFLYLNNNKLTGTIPEELPNLTFELPDLEEYKYIPTWLKAWGKELPHLVFAVQDNQLSGTIPPNFGLRRNISSVQLTNNPLLSGRVPDALCSLEALEVEASFFDCTELLCGCNCTCSGSQ